MKTFLAIGQTGVGKSSFINSTFGVSLAKTSDYEACTRVVEHYTYSTQLGNLRIVDTPGLGESTQAVDISYLNMIKDYVNYNHVDYYLYITPLNETRFRSTEISTLTLINQFLHDKIWQSAWLILTFAGKVPDNRKTETIDVRAGDIYRLVSSFHHFPYYFNGFNKVLVIDNCDPNWGKNWTTDLHPPSKLLME